MWMLNIYGDLYSPSLFWLRITPESYIKLNAATFRFLGYSIWIFQKISFYDFLTNTWYQLKTVVTSLWRNYPTRLVLQTSGLVFYMEDLAVVPLTEDFLVFVLTCLWKKLSNLLLFIVIVVDIGQFDIICSDQQSCFRKRLRQCVYIYSNCNSVYNCGAS